MRRDSDGVRSLTQSYHHGDLRAALMTQTLALVASDQAHRIGFRELARLLKVSRTAPYRHFASVDALLAAVASEGFSAFLVALDAALQSVKGGARDSFLELGVAYIEFALQKPAHYRLMFDQKFYKKTDFPEVGVLAAKAFALLKATVAACLPKDATDQQKVEIASLAWACVHGLAKLMIDGQLATKRNPQEKRRFVRSSCQRLLALVGTYNLSEKSI